MNPRTAVPAVLRAARLLPARIRHGRPGILIARLAGALVMAETILHSGASPPATAGTLAGIMTWLATTARGDLAPPPGR
jgi:hypothetical protein